MAEAQLLAPADAKFPPEHRPDRFGPTHPENSRQKAGSLTLYGTLKGMGVDITPGPSFVFSRMTAGQWPEVRTLLGLLTDSDLDDLSSIASGASA